LPIFDCNKEKKNAECRSYESHPAFVRFFRTGEAAFARFESDPALLLNVPWQVPLNTLFSRCLHR
jgi:hypothetical protein